MNRSYEHYISLIEADGSGDPFELIASTIVDMLPDRAIEVNPIDPFMVLDVGAGSREPTAKFIDAIKPILSGRQKSTNVSPVENPNFSKPVICTAIDSVPIEPHIDARERTEIYFSPKAVERFETDQSFDTVLYLHSTYVIDAKHLGASKA